MKIIFFEGVDGSGKSSRALRLYKTQEVCSYFRSSYQIGSKFCHRQVDLEESIKHDWRILYDFISQTELTKPFLLVDRGFISSFVYSKVLRKKDIWRYVSHYVNLFKSSSEFWFFIRNDNDNMSHDEVQINNLFKEVFRHLQKELYRRVRLFVKTSDGIFKTEDFLNLDEEIAMGHLDADYYRDKLDKFIHLAPKDSKRMILDLDGTLIKSGGALGDQEVYIKSNLYHKAAENFHPLLITGRDEFQFSDLFYLSLNLNKRYHELSVIYNNRNLGLSSRVLKQFCLNYLSDQGIEFSFYDDREDIMDHLFINYSIDGHIYRGESKALQ